MSAATMAPAAAASADRPLRRERTGRLAALDGMRLIAALGVVLYHYVALPDGWGRSAGTVFPGASGPAAYGWLGVQLFFLISGFVICMSAWGRGLGDFFVSRAARLYPAYWFAVLLTAAVTTVWPLTHAAPRWSNVLANLTMLHEPLGVPSVDGVYWTLWVELRFYLLFAIVVWRGLTYRRAVLFCAIWTAVSVIAERSQLPALQIVVDQQYSGYFIAGIAFYLIYRYGSSLLLWGIVAISFLLMQHQIWVTHQGVQDTIGHQLPNWPVVAILAGFFALLGAAALGLFDRIRWRWLTPAGALTYSLYLLHAEIGWVVIRSFRGDIDPRLLVAVCVAGAVLAAWIVQRFVERPGGRRMRSGLRRAMRDLHDADDETGADNEPWEGRHGTVPSAS